MTGTSSRWWLRSDSEEIVIDAPAEAIYDLLAEMPRMGEWSPECQQVEWTNGATCAVVDATFVGHNKGGPAGLMKWSRNGRILEADRGRAFAFFTEEGGRESTVWRYELEPVDGGTAVTESFQLKPAAWSRLYWTIAGWARGKTNERGMRQTLERIRTIAEAA